jgi:TolB-like protein/Flp pilus assembly protein TadD
VAATDLIGRRLSHYRLLEVIGAGGVGIVYRAHDEHLDRDVAVKVLSDQVLSDVTARRRFRREALTLSRLNHPHINTVHDFDSQDGLEFLVVEFVKGENLSERIARGPLPVAESLRLAVQVAQALAAAHEHHVVHRDLKPGNIMLTSQGDAKVLDFGLARQLRPHGDARRAPETTLTEASMGGITGTVPYMAPEQLMAGTVDPRTDLWAFGAMLYEMVVGHRPFDAEHSVPLINAILNEPVPFPPEVKSGISPALRSVICKCLEKDPRNRYASASELITDLERVIAGDKLIADRAPRAWPIRGIAVVAGTVVLAMLIMVSRQAGWIDGLSTLGRSPVFQSLAVLPLENLSGDPAQEHLADGLTEDLIVAFSRIGKMRIVARGSVMHFKGSSQPVVEIANTLGVDAVLEGSVRRSGNRVLVTVALVRASTGQNAWADRYDRPAEDLPQLQGSITSAVIRAAHVAVSRQERARLSKRRQVNPEAYEAYLRGRYYWNEFSAEGFRKAVDQFNHAIEIQPDYAAAFAGLADAYYGLSSIVLPPKEAMPRVRGAADRALTFDPDLPNGFTARALARAFYDWDWKGAELDFKRAIALAPGDAEARLNYGNMLVVLGRFDEASEQLARAHELDPLSSFISSVQLWPLYEGRKYDEAIQLAQSKIAADSTSWNAIQVMAQALIQKRQFPAAYRAITRALSIRGMDTTETMGGYYAALGRADLAHRQFERFLKKHPADYNLALAYATLGDIDRAFAILERDVETRNEGIVFLKVDPSADPLRGDPRYAALLRRMNLLN